MAKSKGGPLGRKDARKVMKQNEKLKKQVHHLQHKVKSAVAPVVEAKSTKSTNSVAKVSNVKDNDKAKSDAKQKQLSEQKSKLAYKDPFIEAEDAEIARLGKLLGIEKGKSKKSVSKKLNKEYELYEVTNCLCNPSVP